MTPTQQQIQLLIETITYCCPALRYGQIIGNALGAAKLPQDPYYVTDEDLQVALARYLQYTARQEARP